MKKTFKHAAGILGASVTALMFFVSQSVAHAQVYTTTLASSTPGVPTTGLGGDVFLNLFLLLIAAFLVVSGTVYLSKPNPHTDVI